MVNGKKNNKLIRLYRNIYICMKGNKSIIREIFSSGPDLIVSSKRVFGAIALLVALGCTMYLTILSSDLHIAENLIEMAYIVGASLLGVASVTSIWKQPNKK